MCVQLIGVQMDEHLANIKKIPNGFVYDSCLFRTHFKGFHQTYRDPVARILSCMTNGFTFPPIKPVINGTFCNSKQQQNKSCIYKFQPFQLFVTLSFIYFIHIISFNVLMAFRTIMGIYGYRVFGNILYVYKHVGQVFKD
jgi:hypothetical protein